MGVTYIQEKAVVFYRPSVAAIAGGTTTWAKLNGK